MDSSRKFYPARPTEYRGEVFKSKSEAIFARVLAEHVDETFEYEPEWTKLPCGYVADFDTVHLSFLPLYTVQIQTIIEYKPGPVTQTYKTELLDRFNAVRNSQPGYTTTAVQYTLITGNAYDTAPCTIEVMDDSGRCFVPYPRKDSLWRLKQWLVEAKDYRFDLEVADED